ncbi:MAG TPA: DUF167 domain-containing protein [Stellaceae bacterium]|nr:DUF167 domain-containing protein [Stellaceae bacterium]
MRIRIRLTPRGRADRIDGVAPAADGSRALKVSVTAPPAENRANEALLRLLAREWRVPRRDLAIVSGATSRDKVVRIAGDPAALLARFGTAIAALPAG